MKYIIELEKIEGTELCKAVGANTLVFDEKGIERILTPYAESKESEIDWAKVPEDTKVRVWDIDGSIKRNRYFSHYGNGAFYCYTSGASSWNRTGLSNWKHCELAETVKEEWLKK